MTLRLMMRGPVVLRAMTAVIAVAACTQIPLALQRAPVVSGVVSDDAGRAIAGAVVVATRAGGLPAPPYSSPPADASGRYVFDALPPGNYVLGVTIASQAAPLPDGAVLAPGAMRGGESPATATTIVDRDGRTFATVSGPLPSAVDGRAMMYAPAFHGGAGVLERARLVQVDPTQQRADVDIVLPRRARVRVAGAVTLALPPGAIDTTEPYRVIVRLMPGDMPTTPPRGVLADEMPIASTIAAADGTFVFPAVPAGRYVMDAFRAIPPPSVRVLATGLPVVVPADRIDGDPDGMAAAQAMTIGDADMDGLAIVLRPSGPASRAALQVRARGVLGGPPAGGRGAGTGANRGVPLPPGRSRGASAIAGRLIDPSGAPLAGVQILAAQHIGDALLPMGSGAITDAEGRYRIGGLGPGAYIIVAPSLVTGIRGPELVPNAFPPSTSSDNGKLAYVTTFHPATTDVTAAAVVNVGLAERTGVDIVLQQRPVSDLAGVVQGGSSVGGVTLLPENRAAQLGGRNVRRERISPDGTFVFSDVPDGRFTVFYSSPGGWARASVVMPDAATAGPLRLPLERYLSVAGRVTIEGDPEGVLPPVLTVRLTPEPLTPGDVMPVSQVRPDGTFALGQVVPGNRYFLRAMTTPPWRQISGSIDGTDAFQTALSISQGSTTARIVITNR